MVQCGAKPPKVAVLSHTSGVRIIWIGFLERRKIFVKSSQRNLEAASGVWFNSCYRWLGKSQVSFSGWQIRLRMWKYFSLLWEKNDF